MSDSDTVQLTTLWFVVVLFVQTGGSADNAVVNAIGFLALLLMYILPVVIAGRLVSRTLAD
jgi:hypothetical protein